MVRSIWLAPLALHAGMAIAAPAGGKLNYGKPAAWVLPPPAPTDAAAPADMPYRFAYSDLQVHLSPEGQATYSAYRVRILKPEALQIGNVALAWKSITGSATVHRLQIIRDGKTIDLLKDHHFQILQREGGLEQSMLDGELTAALQAPDLRVGDELEFAATVTERDPTLPDHAFGFGRLQPQGMPGAFRFTLSWPQDVKLAWRATRDLAPPQPETAAGRTRIAFELRDPGGAIINEGAPARYNVRRLIEYSDFASWSDVSRRFSGLFEEAARLAPDSPLHAEAAKIMAASSDPIERAQAALRLVQDQIRYVYVGLDGGNYRPAKADETWSRRFGDCKGKTVLLLALLRALKIDAEPVLVDALGGDGTDARLPSPTMFNHVLVRATIGGKRHWLDGTRLGDRYLDQLPDPPFRWALPLRPDGSDLEPVPPHVPDRPLFVGIVDIDASAGLDKPARVTATQVLRQNAAWALRTHLTALSREDADRMLQVYWRGEMDWALADHTEWRYDERRAVLLLTMTGQGMPGWEGDDREGHRLYLPGAGFYEPPQRRRPREQDQNAPWLVDFPAFKCWATTVHLPKTPPERHWTYFSAPVELKLGGISYWRAAGLKDGTMRTVMSHRSDTPEISAAEAKATNDFIPYFNDKMSMVYQARDGQKDEAAISTALPFADGVDWAGDVPMCSAPAGKRDGTK